MNKTELNKELKEIISIEDDLTAKNRVDELIKNLQKDEDSQKILQIYENKKLRKHTYMNDTIAYNLLINNEFEKCIDICKNIVAETPKHLKGNYLLSVAYRLIDEIDLAFATATLIKDEYGDKEFVIENFNLVSEIVKNMQEENEIFLNASDSLIRENVFIISKLKNFIKAFANDKDYDNKQGTLDIAKWKFAKMMNVDAAVADNLRQQWLQKKYILDTQRRGDYSVKIYKINPHLQEKIKEKTETQLSDKWTSNLSKVDSKYLEELQYFENRSKLLGIDEPYKSQLVEEYDELFINYVFQNKKSIVMLSNSFIYGVLLYYLDKNDLMNENKSELHSIGLESLVKIFESNNILESQYLSLVNVTRIYKDYANIGVGLTSNNALNTSKIEICINSVLELIREIV